MTTPSSYHYAQVRPDTAALSWAISWDPVGNSTATDSSGTVEQRTQAPLAGNEAQP